MTGPAAGEPGRGRGTPSRTGTRDAASSVLIVLGVGLVLRLIIAYLLPGSGFKVDLDAFRYWANDLATNGPWGFYDRPFFHDYTPGYLYVLWAVGIVAHLLGGANAAIGDLIKAPPILSDLALGYLAWSMTRELGAGRRAALIAGLIVVVNPITWFDSVAWGQVDSFGVVFLLLGIRELWRDRPERSAIFTVIAAITKPQLGILVPVVAAITIRRALWPAGGYGDDGAPLGLDGTTDWERRTRGPVRILTTGLAGFATAIAISLPFGLSLPGLVEQLFKTAGGYPYLTVNAWNPWALVSLHGRGVAQTSQWVCDAVAAAQRCSEAVTFGGIPAVVVGATILAVAIAAVVFAIALRPDRRTILVGVAVLALAFFVLPTRVHERYLFPLVPLGAILAAVSLRWRIAYVLSSLATIANMYAVLTTLYPNNPGVADWFHVGRALLSYPSVALAAVVQLGVFVFAVSELRGTASDRLGEAIEWSAEADEAGATARTSGWALPRAAVSGSPVGTGGERAMRRDVRASSTSDLATPPRPSGAPGAAVESSAASAVSSAASPGPGRASPRWYERPTYTEAGARGWLVSRLFDRPVRADRTATLQSEPGGRLDRLDVWIVLVLVASLLTVRMWRLGEPYQMHFDEVYHPRTATEFLQDWRYGLSHDIYEWTHPHLAKYAMALGIEAFGDDRTSATSDLGVPVASAAVEHRWDDPTRPDQRNGDRLWIATGSSVRAYDLATRDLTISVDLPGARSVAVDQVLHRVYVGTASGEIRILDTRTLDVARQGGQPSASALVFVRIDGSIGALFVPRAGTSLVAVLGDTGPTAGSSQVVTVDASKAAEVGRVPLSGVTELADSGVGQVAIANGAGLTFLDPSTGKTTSTLDLGGPAMGVAQTRELGDDRLYASYVSTSGPRVARVTGVDAKATGAPHVESTMVLPGRTAGWVGYDDASMMVHVLGDTSVSDGGRTSTVYVIEPHADAVYEDARVPFAPTALAFDTDQRYPSSDRQQILAFTSAGTAASVETGKHAFAWRVPGVLAGVAMAALLYLLTRLLFRRRSIAVALAFLTLVDGMLFVQSRIGMNDSYVGLGIVAAYTLFAALWLRPGGSRRFWVAFAIGMPVVGVLLGLALAAKWVAAYAIGALGILVVARSALGRLLLVAGMIVLTTVLGYMAISVPGNGPGANYLFLAIMVALTLAAAVVNVLHPVAWTWQERRLATFGPAALGVVIAAVAVARGLTERSFALGPVAAKPLELAFALVLASGLVHAAFVFVGRWGFGPLAPPPRPDDPAALLDPPAQPPEGWLDLGSGFGVPALWTLASVVVLPLVIYVISYIPWAQVEGHRLWEPGQLFGLATTSWPPGHTGQTLWDLTQQMYRYHNTLSSPHPASSPWWAWLFDFKPVWFYQETFAGGTTGAIYDSGNLVAWWIGVPAMLFAAWAAYRRRSVALGLVVVGFACQWLAWARIDRAAFQYHYYTSLPFLFIALAYFLAELWHGASRRLWLVARLSAAAAILAPTTLWLLHRPFCGFVRVTDVNPGSRACPTLIPDFVLTARAAGIAIVLGIGLLVLLRILLDVDGRVADDDAERGGRVGGLARPAGAASSVLGPFGPAILAAIAVTAAYVVATRFLTETPLLTLTNVPVEPVALLVTVALLPVAGYVATARDARRFVAGLLVVMGFWFVLWYPNLAALPLPTALSNAYQGLLPTYVYPFQFPVSTVNRNVAGPPLISMGSIALLVAITIVTVVVAYSAWVSRLADAERRAIEDAPPEGASAAG